MEIRILFCLLGLFGSALSLEVSYNGPELFPMNEEATLLCQISPTPNTPEGANNLAVWWSQVDLATGTRTKLGKSSVDESYLYSSIPNGLNYRFTTSTDEFIYGIAKASIANVGIADDKTYQCEVEDLTTHDATDTQFKLNVYLEPDVQIYDEETNLDIRPIKQTEPTETATENPIYDDAIPDTPAPAAVNVNVSIAQCVATNAFPKPTKFEFVSDSTGNTWTVVNENEIMYVENADGTFNASAVLRIDPSAELDGAEISCRTWLYPSLSYASAGTTSPIVVKHMTNEATISLSTTEAVEGDRVSISCTANGNPPPTIELQDPAGNIHNVTGVNYVISRAQVEHAGVYVCHAYNDADATLATAEGTLSVEWVGNPRVKNNGNRIVNKLVEVTLGDSINIVCSAQGYPAPQITVVRGTQPLQGSTVARNSVTYADAGTYSCKAATGNIVKITNFQVVVNGGCVVSLQKVVSSSMEDEDGAYVNLKCTATGHPACSMSMEPYGEYQPSSPGDNQLEMTIPDMKKQVSPVNFTCQASNNLGSHSATVILTDEAVCCVEPHKGGIGTGVVIIIILLVAVVLVGVPLAVYCYKKKESEKARSAKEEKELEADEGVKMNPGDELRVQYESQDDFRLNNSKPMRTFSQKN